LITETAFIGVPIGGVIGADAVFLNTMLFWFIPAIRNIIATGSMESSLAPALLGMQNKSKKNFI